MSRIEEQIRSYMYAAFPILYIHTFEEEKAKEIIRNISAGIPQVLEWDGTDRICDLRTGEAAYDLSLYSLPDILDDRMSYQRQQVLVFRNISVFMEEPAVMVRLKKLAERIYSGESDTTIFIVSPVLRIPEELEKYVTVLEMDYLTVNEIRSIIQAFCADGAIQISEALEKEFADALKGLSELEIRNVLQLAYAQGGELTRNHITLIFEQKRQMIRKAGILEMVPMRERMSDIGGLENLKRWLERKAAVLARIDEARAFGVDMPKGVLIAGVPGCGKSLSAKAAAKLFNIPLLRLDMGRLLGKYVGESENNMRRAIQLAEAVSPCVLWIDELEKAFAGIGGDGSGAEVTTRLFGSFLTWLQEKDSAAFVVATANDITKLPPELMRKGRFDEIFYVGLPNSTERRKIFEIHLGKRRPQDLPSIDIGRLVEKTEGYSGADIEGVVREGVEAAFAGGQEHLTTEDILCAVRSTHSLSEIMKEPIEKMEREYKSRKFKNAST
ncbi:MAG: AAA family ATPase [Oscillospiraceae bacterium]|nr:AAA family ATPase [Oscillospiraceae bacterium]